MRVWHGVQCSYWLALVSGVTVVKLVGKEAILREREREKEVSDPWLIQLSL